MKLESLFLIAIECCFVQILVGGNVVSEKLLDTSAVNGKRTAVTVIDLNPYRVLINLY